MAVLAIDTLTPQGEGLGRLAGRVVFVPGALPGETVEVELIFEKKTIPGADWSESSNPLRNALLPPARTSGCAGGANFNTCRPRPRTASRRKTFGPPWSMP